MRIAKTVVLFQNQNDSTTRLYIAIHHLIMVINYMTINTSLTLDSNI